MHQTLEWINGYLGDSNDSLSKSTLKIHLRICEPSCATSIKNFPSNDVEKSKFLNPKFFLFSIFVGGCKKKGALLKEEDIQTTQSRAGATGGPVDRLFGWIKLQMVHIYADSRSDNSLSWKQNELTCQ